MAVRFHDAQEKLASAAAEIFDWDPAVRSVGIARHALGFGYRAVRNSEAILPSGARRAAPSISMDIPVQYCDSPSDPRPLVLVPGRNSAETTATSWIPERAQYRPLFPGLEIQNFDDDLRKGHIDRGFMSIGTLGGFVELVDRTFALLSNNHVVAGGNTGRRGVDRILQCGETPPSLGEEIALLREFVHLIPSPAGASLMAGTAILNEVDAGVAVLEPSIGFSQAYLRRRNLPTPSGLAEALPQDRVFKVGRTTGLTWGRVTDVSTIVGPVTYTFGPVWFTKSLTIEGLNGTLFSDHGDSGALIVRENGEVVGLLYAGNGRQSYACPIEEVLSQLQCSLV